MCPIIALNDRPNLGLPGKRRESIYCPCSGPPPLGFHTLVVSAKGCLGARCRRP